MHCVNYSTFPSNMPALIATHHIRPSLVPLSILGRAVGDPRSIRLHGEVRHVLQGPPPGSLVRSRSEELKPPTCCAQAGMSVQEATIQGTLNRMHCKLHVSEHMSSCAMRVWHASETRSRGLCEKATALSTKKLSLGDAVVSGTSIPSYDLAIETGFNLSATCAGMTRSFVRSALYPEIAIEPGLHSLC